LEFAVAGIGSRFLALAYDVVLQMLIGLVVGLASMMALAGITVVAPKVALWSTAVLVVFYFLLYFGYYAFFEIIWNGQTPGKRKAGIRVIKDSGRPLTPAESIGRNLMRIVDWMPFFYALGMACAFLTKGNKRLGDLVVGSLVVRETSLSDLKPAWESTRAGAAPLASSGGPLGAQNLSAEELALVESFLSRRGALEPDVRFRIADEVLRRIRPKLTLPTDRTYSSEKWLEAVAYERRTQGGYS
jgi:uncharacterized RDD family membrane protein YckC